MNKRSFLGKPAGSVLPALSNSLSLIIILLLMLGGTPSCIASDGPKGGITLQEYAARNPITIYTIKNGVNVPLEKFDQINNFQDGVNVLPLSKKELMDIRGISTLTVQYEGHHVPLTKVPNLQIFLNRNSISEIPAEIGELRNVTFFYFNNNLLEKVPAAFGRIKGLNGVYFTENHIREISPEIFSVRQLRKFEIKGNQLHQIPEEIGNCTGIIHLNLSNNPLKLLPKSIVKLTNLRICDFSYCELSELPEAFGNNQIRYQLRLMGNPDLKRLPSGKGFETMTATINIEGTAIDKKDLSPALLKRLSDKRTPSPNKMMDVNKTAAEE